MPLLLQRQGTSHVWCLFEPCQGDIDLPIWAHQGTSMKLTPTKHLIRSCDLFSLCQCAWQVSCLCFMKPLCRKQRWFHILTVCPHSFSCLTVVVYVPSESCCVCTVDIDGESALSTGIMAGILILAFVLLLLAVDVTCFFTNKCGLIMCLCGKPGSGAKGHNLEQGKAAFLWVSTVSICASRNGTLFSI